STKVVLGIHDVMAQQYPELIFPSKRDRFFWRLKVRLALRQANMIVTVSEHAQRGILNLFKAPKSLVRVVPEAPARVFAPVTDSERLSAALVRYGLRPDQKFLLYVGGMGPHKNLESLIKNFAELIQNPRFADVTLAIVGDKED